MSKSNAPVSATAALPVAFPLQTTMASCPRCSALCLVRMWHHSSKHEPPRMETLAQPVSPVTGEVHRCSTQEVSS